MKAKKAKQKLAISLIAKGDRNSQAALLILLNDQQIDLNTEIHGFFRDPHKIRDEFVNSCSLQPLYVDKST